MSSIRVNFGSDDPGLRNFDIRVSGMTSKHSNTPIVHDGIGITTRRFDLHPETGVVVFLDVTGLAK